MNHQDFKNTIKSVLLNEENLSPEQVKTVRKKVDQMIKKGYDQSFKDRYGDSWKSVMFGTVTNQLKSGSIKDEYDPSGDYIGEESDKDTRLIITHHYAETTRNPKNWNSETETLTKAGKAELARRLNNNPDHIKIANNLNSSDFNRYMNHYDRIKKMVKENNSFVYQENNMFTRKLNESLPRNEKEKKLAARMPPEGELTHADVLHGRGVLDDTGKIKKNKSQIGESEMQRIHRTIYGMMNEFTMGGQGGSGSGAVVKKEPEEKKPESSPERTQAAGGGSGSGLKTGMASGEGSRAPEPASKPAPTSSSSASEPATKAVTTGTGGRTNIKSRTFESNRYDGLYSAIKSVLVNEIMAAGTGPSAQQSGAVVKKEPEEKKPETSASVSQASGGGSGSGLKTGMAAGEGSRAPEPASKPAPTSSSSASEPATKAVTTGTGGRTNIKSRTFESTTFDRFYYLINNDRG